MAQEQLGPEAVVTTIFCDDNKKYVSTNLLAEEPIREGYLSRDIDLRDFKVIPRA